MGFSKRFEVPRVHPKSLVQDQEGSNLHSMSHQWSFEMFLEGATIGVKVSVISKFIDHVDWCML